MWWTILCQLHKKLTLWSSSFYLCICFCKYRCSALKVSSFPLSSPGVMSQTWCEELFCQMKRSVLGAFSPLFLLETRCPAKPMNFPHHFVSDQSQLLTEMLPRETLNYGWIFRSEPLCNSGISSQHLVQNWDCLQNACLMLRLVPQLWTHLQISLPLHLFLNFMLWWLTPSAVNWNSKIKESLVSGLEPFLTLSPLWVSKDTSPGKCTLSS